MFLSFRLTEQEFRSGRKTCTRRFNMSDRQFKLWQLQWHRGKLVHDAWSNLPFVLGAHRIGKFMLTRCPYWERLGDMPPEDLQAEGGMCATLEEYCRLVRKTPEDVAAVIRFKLFSITR